jgi:glyoxylase-like metal-dependent hydrolase (beta-lactamase superfamily II)
MKVVCLKGNETVYSCNAYIVLGSWNALTDVNTLVDVGTDGGIMEELDVLSTGVGKRPVEQVVLTHNHFDHIGGLREIKARWNPKVYAFTRSEGVDEILHDGQILQMGDRLFEVIHTPGHSCDSISLYCEEEKVLFTGDTPVRIMSIGGSYSGEFVQALEKLNRRTINTIFPGHEGPIREKAKDMMRATLINVKNSGLLASF